MPNSHAHAPAFKQESGMASETVTLRGDAETSATDAPPKNVAQPGAPSERSDSRSLAESYSDVLIIDWDGPDDPENPRK